MSKCTWSRFKLWKHVTICFVKIVMPTKAHRCVYIFNTRWNRITKQVNASQLQSCACASFQNKKKPVTANNKYAWMQLALSVSLTRLCKCSGNAADWVRETETRRVCEMGPRLLTNLGQKEHPPQLSLTDNTRYLWSKHSCLMLHTTFEHLPILNIF